MENSKNEIWKDVIGYEGLYKISNFGKIKSIGSYGIGKRKNDIMLNTSISKSHIYAKVLLSKNFKRKTLLVHRIVAQAFIKNPENLPCVDHISGDKTNNSCLNLRWCTHRQNNSYDNRDRHKKCKLLGASVDGKSFKSTICFESRTYHIGQYKTEQEASDAYHKALLLIDNKELFLAFVKSTKKISNSGEKYIYYDKSINKFSVRITINGKTKTMGKYKQLDLAINKRNQVFNELAQQRFDPLAGIKKRVID